MAASRAVVFAGACPASLAQSGQSNALVMRRSSVRIRQGAHWRIPAQMSSELVFLVSADLAAPSGPGHTGALGLGSGHGHGRGAGMKASPIRGIASRAARSDPSRSAGSGPLVVANRSDVERLGPSTGVRGDRDPTTSTIRAGSRHKIGTRHIPGFIGECAETAARGRRPFWALCACNGLPSGQGGSGSGSEVKPGQAVAARGRPRCRSGLAAVDVLVAGEGVALTHLPCREAGESDGGGVEETEAEQPSVAICMSGGTAEECDCCDGSANGADSLDWLHSDIPV